MSAHAIETIRTQTVKNPPDSSQYLRTVSLCTYSQSHTRTRTHIDTIHTLAHKHIKDIEWKQRWRTDRSRHLLDSVFAQSGVAGKTLMLMGMLRRARGEGVLRARKRIRMIIASPALISHVWKSYFSTNYTRFSIEYIEHKNGINIWFQFKKIKIKNISASWALYNENFQYKL